MKRCYLICHWKVQKYSIMLFFQYCLDMKIEFNAIFFNTVQCYISIFFTLNSIHYPSSLLTFFNFIELSVVPTTCKLPHFLTSTLQHALCYATRSLPTSALMCHSQSSPSTTPMWLAPVPCDLSTQPAGYVHNQLSIALTLPSPASQRPSHCLQGCKTSQWPLRDLPSHLVSWRTSIQSYSSLAHASPPSQPLLCPHPSQSLSILVRCFTWSPRFCEGHLVK